MPAKKKKGDDDPTLKKAKAKSPSKAKAQTKRKPRTKSASSGKRGERDKLSRTLGETIRKKIKLTEDLPEFEPTPGIKKTGLDSLLEGESIKANKQFNASFRGLGPNMDEFFSTASMREFVKGLLGDQGWSDFAADEQEYLGEIVDVLSAIRVPTKYVGYSFSTGKLQHPTSREEAYFEDPYATASGHSQIDTARRDYVQRVAQSAIDSGGSARDIVLASGRAAIEFTLNNFMAPISASNVQPHSKMASLEVTDEKILEQLRWREFLKNYYVDVLGGKLRDVDPTETKKASRSRGWQPQSDLQLSVPPSPFRNVESGALSDEEEEEVVAIQLDTIVPSAPPLDETLEQSGLNVFGQSTKASDDLSLQDLDEYGQMDFQLASASPFQTQASNQSSFATSDTSMFPSVPDYDPLLSTMPSAPDYDPLLSTMPSVPTADPLAMETTLSTVGEAEMGAEMVESLVALL